MKYGYGDDTTYRSQGVHKNRDSTAKMKVDAMDRNGVTDSEKQAQMEQAAAAASAATKNSSIGVDERVSIGRSGTTAAAEAATKAGHDASMANIRNVEPGRYNLMPQPGSGSSSSWGKEGTTSNPAPSGSGQQDMMGGMAMGMMGGGGGEGGGGMMSGLPGAIGNDIASMDDSIDRANNQLFYDSNTHEMARQRGEREQGR